MEISPQKPYKKVFLEITNICNLACPFCAGTSKPPRHMERDLFFHILGEIKPLAQEIVFHVTGEPTLHPLFPEFVQAAGKEGFSLMLTTNGTAWSAGVRPRFDPGLFRQINISLHAYGAVPDFEAWLNGILDFCDEAKIRFPQTYINLRLWNSFDPFNGRIIDKINRRWRLQIAIPEKAQANLGKSKVLLGGLASLNFDNQFAWPHATGPVIHEAGFCHGLENHFGILSDGTVIPCCLDSGGALCLGHVPDKALADILQTQRAQDIRSDFSRGFIIEDFCKRCGYIGRFAGKALKRRRTE
jgi:radical SAM protein with 4Fe4S-binding SPASM domain